MEREERELTVSLLGLWTALRRGFWFILLAGLITAALTTTISVASYTPEYTAKTDVYIINESYQNLAGEPSNDINTYNLALNLIVDCKQIIEGKETKTELGKRLGLSDEEIKGIEITVAENSKNKSRILNISITSQDPELSYRLSNEMLAVAQDKISKFCSHDVKLVNSAELPEAAVNSPIRPYVLVATFLVVVGVYLAFLLQTLLDDRIHTEKEVEALALCLLAEIPNAEEMKRGKKQGGYYAACEDGNGGNDEDC